MSSAEIKQRIDAIDAMLDDDSITDAEYDALEAEIRRLLEEKHRAEQAERLQAVPVITPSEWLQGFLNSFPEGTRVITNKQAAVFVRVNHGQKFICDGRLYRGFAPNYRAGFTHVIITKID